VLKLEVAPVQIIEMTTQHIGHIGSWHTLKCPAYDISYGQKKHFKTWISRNNKLKPVSGQHLEYHITAEPKNSNFL